MAPIGAKSPQTDKARTRHGHGSDKPGAATDITDTPDTADSPDGVLRGFIEVLQKIPRSSASRRNHISASKAI